MILATLFYDVKNQQILTKSLFQKFNFIQVSRLQLMHDYAHWHLSINYSVNLSLTKNEKVAHALTHYFTLK